MQNLNCTDNDQVELVLQVISICAEYRQLFTIKNNLMGRVFLSMAADPKLWDTVLWRRLPSLSSASFSHRFHNLNAQAARLNLAANIYTDTSSPSVSSIRLVPPCEGRRTRKKGYGAFVALIILQHKWLSDPLHCRKRNYRHFSAPSIYCAQDWGNFIREKKKPSLYSPVPSNFISRPYLKTPGSQLGGNWKDCSVFCWGSNRAKRHRT